MGLDTAPLGDSVSQHFETKTYFYHVTLYMPIVLLRDSLEQLLEQDSFQATPLFNETKKSLPVFASNWTWLHFLVPARFPAEESP